MSNLLKNTSLSINAADKIISDTLHKCDDGELYLEDTKFETVTLDDNKIKSSDYSTDTGYGFRAVTDDVIAYSHSNEISEESLKKSSENLKSTLKGKSGTYNSSIKKTNQKFYKDIDPIETKSLDSKIELLNLMNDFKFLHLFIVFLHFLFHFMMRTCARFARAPDPMMGAI